MSETKISRMKSEGDIRRMAEFLSAVGLKVVPVDQKTYRQESIAALMQLARERMEQLESPDQLAED